MQPSIKAASSFDGPRHFELQTPLFRAIINRNNSAKACLSSVMVTLCMTDFMDAFPDVNVVVHNLGGNIAFEIERMDHRCLLDTPSEELPSTRFKRSKVMVDCNSFGARAIEMAVGLYGADRIVCGTDGSAFGVEWTRRALEEARISSEERARILTGNAAGVLGMGEPMRQAAE